MRNSVWYTFSGRCYEISTWRRQGGSGHTNVKSRGEVRSPGWKEVHGLSLVNPNNQRPGGRGEFSKGDRAIARKEKQEPAASRHCSLIIPTCFRSEAGPLDHSATSPQQRHILKRSFRVHSTAHFPSSPGRKVILPSKHSKQADHF